MNTTPTNPSYCPLLICLHLYFVQFCTGLFSSYIWTIFSMLYDKDAGHRTFIDDVYECQMRLPGTNWVESSRPSTNVVRSIS